MVSGYVYMGLGGIFFIYTIAILVFVFIIYTDIDFRKNNMLKPFYIPSRIF